MTHGALMAKCVLLQLPIAWCLAQGLPTLLHPWGWSRTTAAFLLHGHNAQQLLREVQKANLPTATGSEWSLWELVRDLKNGTGPG